MMRTSAARNAWQARGPACAAALVLVSILGITACEKDDEKPFVPDTQPPAAVTDLTAEARGEMIRLRWTAPGDDSLSGRASAYDVRYALHDFTAEQWNDLLPISGEPHPGPAGSRDSLDFFPLTPRPAGHFALKAVDESGNWSGMSNVAAIGAEHATWTVAADGSGDFTSIPPAIETAADGDTIFIGAGEYTDPLTITGRTLVLVGAGVGETRIHYGWDPSEQKPALRVSTSRLTLRSLTVTQEHISCQTAIIADSSRVAIEDCALLSCGVTANECDLTLTGCTLWSIPMMDCDMIVPLVSLRNTSAVLERNILTGHPYGIICDLGASIDPACNDVWCTSENYDGCPDPTGLFGNISADPRFVNPGEDFRLRADSPCASGATPGCGRMGAFPVAP